VNDHAAVEAAIEAFASGDPERVVRHIDPEFVGEVPASMSAEPDDYVGYDGVRRYFETFEEAIEGLRFESRRIEDDGDWFIAHLRISGRGRVSGLPVDLEAYAAVFMRDGKLLRMRGRPTLEEARAATLDDGPC
jgi:ketosteroid isomerase-like protein